MAGLADKKTTRNKLLAGLDVSLVSAGSLLVPALVLDSLLSSGAGGFWEVGVSLYSLVVFGGLTALFFALVFEFGMEGQPALSRLRDWGRQPATPAKLLAVGLALLLVFPGLYLAHRLAADTFITGFKNKELSAYMLNLFEYAALFGGVLAILALARVIAAPIRFVDGALAGRVSDGWRSGLYGLLLGVIALASVFVVLGGALNLLPPRPARMILLALVFGSGLLAVTLLVRVWLPRLRRHSRPFGFLRVGCGVLLVVFLLFGGVSASRGEAVGSAVTHRPGAALGDLWLPMAKPPAPSKPSKSPTRTNRPVNRAR